MWISINQSNNQDIVVNFIYEKQLDRGWNSILKKKQHVVSTPNIWKWSLIPSRVWILLEDTYI